MAATSTSYWPRFARVASPLPAAPRCLPRRGACRAAVPAAGDSRTVARTAVEHLAAGGVAAAQVRERNALNCLRAATLAGLCRNDARAAHCHRTRSSLVHECEQVPGWHERLRRTVESDGSDREQHIRRGHEGQLGKADRPEMLADRGRQIR